MGRAYRGTIVCMLACTVIIVLSFVIRKVIFKKKIKLSKELPNYILGVYMVGVLAVTLWPIAIGTGSSMSLVPFSDVSFQIRENFNYWLKTTLLNIFLFIPMGTLIAFKVNKNDVKGKTKCLLFGCIISIVIEIIQYMSQSGRNADVDDVIFNSCGFIIGMFLYWVYIKVKRPVSAN